MGVVWFTRRTGGMAEQNETEPILRLTAGGFSTNRLIASAIKTARVQLGLIDGKMLMLSESAEITPATFPVNSAKKGTINVTAKNLADWTEAMELNGIRLTGKWEEEKRRFVFNLPERVHAVAEAAASEQK